MSEEMKARSFRMADETADKFREICNGFPNQNAALESLMNAYEVQKAAAVLTERTTDITDYNAHIQALQAAFLHSLEVTENTEQRIRTEFQRLLNSKDQTIQDLQERVIKAEQAAQTAQEQSNIIESEMFALKEATASKINDVNAELKATIEALEQAKEQISDKQSQIADKQALLDESRKQLENALQSAEKVVELEVRTTAAEKAHKAAELENVRLQEEITKLKSDYESRISIMQAQSDIEKQQAVLAEQQKTAQLTTSHAEELKKLYAEINELRREKSKK